MNITVKEFAEIIDSVGDAAKLRKKIISDTYKRTIADDFDLPIKWYRSRKNADIKDALALEGVKRGFSVRAEKVMGALPEYCKDSDQILFNRFDLSWEKTRNSREFTLAVEIEMDINIDSVMKDFRKLINNKSDCLKAMVCQVKNDSEESIFKSAAKKELLEAPKNVGSYVLSIWSWPRGEFVHYNF